MGDHERSQEIDAPVEQLFDYLADVGNLPRYFTAMTSAEPAGGETVRVVANEHGTTHDVEAWFRVDREHQHLEWGSEGPSSYHGHLDVTGDAATSTVTVSLHTERADSASDATEIDQGITETLANVKRLVETGPAPGPTS